MDPDLTYEISRVAFTRVAAEHFAKQERANGARSVRIHEHELTVGGCTRTVFVIARGRGPNAVLP